MMETVGHAVSRLIRIRYGAMVLPHGLRRGAWIELDEADIRSLMKAAGVSERSGPSASGPQRGRGRADRSPRTGGRGLPGTALPSAPRGKSRPARGPSSNAPKGQPDPMRTSLGYIGADSFNRQKQSPGGPGRGGRRNAGGRSR
jgi:23S rRNA pseudouridine2605 synthase